jgi:glycosyltransferase involved in cell wall biosynthesis
LLSRILSPQSPPLKILHIASGDLWAGAEVQAYTLLSTLQQNAAVSVAAALLNDGELAERLRAQHIDVKIFPEQTLNGLQILLGLRQLMLAWQPDVVHTHRIKENVLGALANALAYRRPALRTAHGASEHTTRGLRQLHKSLFRRLDHWCGLRLQDRIIAVTGDLASKMTAEYPREKIVVIENGVALTEPAQLPASTLAFAADATHIGIVGRLEKVKRVDLFLEMAALLKKQVPQQHWRFHIFGDGVLREQLMKQSEHLGLTDVAIFHGHRSDILSCIARLDALVMCSDHEGMPMTLLEAMNIGTPVVGHEVGGIAELLDHNRHGWGVTQHSADAYARAVQTALTERTSDATRLQHARTNIRARYSAQACADKHLELYRRLLTA